MKYIWYSPQKSKYPCLSFATGETLASTRFSKKSVISHQKGVISAANTFGVNLHVVRTV